MSVTVETAKDNGHTYCGMRIGNLPKRSNTILDDLEQPLTHISRSRYDSVHAEHVSNGTTQRHVVFRPRPHVRPTHRCRSA